MNEALDGREFLSFFVNSLLIFVMFLSKFSLFFKFSPNLFANFPDMS